MSSKLPVVSGQSVIKAFEKTGYYIRSQQGSHVHLRHPVRPPLTIPAHKEIARGTLRAIIRQAGFSVEEFSEFLKR
jgi:predicted RNA binding protein YcfA (HicA-like mRNA interferase family)